MSNSQHRVEDFLNPDFERYMSEKNVAVMLSHTSCSHEIAFPEDGGVGVDYASIETRGGIATGSRDVGPFAVCNCVDEMNFDELAGSWAEIAREQIKNSVYCFTKLLEHLEERGVLQDGIPVDVEIRLVEMLAKTMDEPAEKSVKKPAVIDLDADCIRGLTD